jgi:hypothetical protein
MNNKVGIKPDQYLKMKSDNDSDMTTRGNSRRFQKESVHKDVHQYSFFHSTAADWNQLNEKTATAESRDIFKQRLQR